jgi:hypothetical protein
MRCGDHHRVRPAGWSALTTFPSNWTDFSEESYRFAPESVCDVSVKKMCPNDSPPLPRSCLAPSTITSRAAFQGRLLRARAARETRGAHRPRIVGTNNGRKGTAKRARTLPEVGGNGVDWRRRGPCTKGHL